MLMCKYIFPGNYISTYLMTYSSRWHCLIHNDDVIFTQITAGKKQKNIISKNVNGLNGFTAKQLLSFDGGCGE